MEDKIPRATLFGGRRRNGGGGVDISASSLVSSVEAPQLVDIFGSIICRNIGQGEKKGVASHGFWNAR